MWCCPRDTRPRRPGQVRATPFTTHTRRGTISKPVRVNERIRIREVRLIDEEGTQLGIVPTFQALSIARERGLDLVEVAPNAIPPVCRIMDYGKARYEQSRKERESRRNSKAITIKEVRLKPKTDDHDLDTKSRRAKEFLEDGDKVKLTVLFRGRENLHPEVGRALLDRMLDQLGPYAIIESTPRLEGRNMSAMLAPKKQPQPQGATASQGQAPRPERPREQGATPVAVPAGDTTTVAEAPGEPTAD
ncbi:MAG: Translation initiation factor 3 [uncultured Thermomicrobiales bacterium]|uniref:Translation initiation factor IF-3 n=1 Tax=uncultured Thermomicrobiales bacterium TaxID=1645740 RepID=A0A6J4V2V0_9BACT|nr:MAG: Translation initiation factor 3 [uncultured Thermomicrobiales bacterium]